MTNDGPNPQLELFIPGDLDYVYRDFFTVFAGPDDVILEFGNVNRAMSNQVRIANRIVLTPANAARLREILDRTLAEMQRRFVAPDTLGDGGDGTPSGHA